MVGRYSLQGLCSYNKYFSGSVGRNEGREKVWLTINQGLCNHTEPGNVSERARSILNNGIESPCGHSGGLRLHIIEPWCN